MILYRVGRILRSVKTFFTITGASFVLIIISLIIAEVLARIATYDPAPMITVYNQASMKDPWGAFRNTPGYEYNLGGVVYTRINKWGWRGSEYPKKKPDGVKRAILLGDSVAFSGYGIFQEVSLEGQLEIQLKSLTGETWQVINMAVPGGFGGISLSQMAHQGIHFNPDIVVTLNGNNDLLVIYPAAKYLLTGVGNFPQQLYHASQLIIERVFDPRTGRGDLPLMLKILARESAFLRWLNGKAAHGSIYDVFTNELSKARETEVSIENPARLDHFVESQLAIAHLTVGSGAIFVNFLQPYLSLEHDQRKPLHLMAIENYEKTNPKLLPFLDKAYPVLRKKLQKAATENSNFNFVDLSLMLINENVLADAVHMTSLSPVSMPGNDLVAGRMAKEMVRIMKEKEITFP